MVSCKQAGGEHPQPCTRHPWQLSQTGCALHPGAKHLPGSHRPCQQRSSCSCSTLGVPGAKTNKQKLCCSVPTYLKYFPDYLLEILPPQSSHCACQEDSPTSRAFLHQCPLSFSTSGRNTGSDSERQLQLFPVGNSFSSRRRGAMVLCGALMAPFSPH